MDEFASRHYPIKEHMGFQRRMWVVERIGWLVLVAIALIALTGLLGNGWLSQATANNGGLSVEYERFARATKLERFIFRFPPGARGERALSLNRVFQENFEIASIEPRPVRSEAGPDGPRMIFAVPSSGGAVTVWAHARGYGISRIEARGGESEPLAFSIMTYP
jgi:hypothetical protein